MDRLTNTARPYAWGSATAIPKLLGVEPTGEPQAELWMGAHPGAPSHIDRGDGLVALHHLIEADPEGELGPEAVRAFGPRLPFLLKILAAEAPLSLQVHPDLPQARAGFADEEERAVPIDAPHRTYKDAGHKPELLCALTPFDGLCGFRPMPEAAALLAGLAVDSLGPYVDTLRAGHAPDTLREVFTGILTASRETMAATVEQAAAAAERLGAADGPYRVPYRDDYAAYASIARHHPGDPGVIAAMLLNFVQLRPGEALYLGAGVPHAYLAGVGVEIMANSDNVLRCGLTPKHVDVPELLRIVRFEPSVPEVLRPEPVDGEEAYETPTAEFRLSRYAVADRARITGPVAPQILLCTEGRIELHAVATGRQLTLKQGQSVFVPADAVGIGSVGAGVEVRGSGVLFRATVSV
ncbi:mannose-6-phosphate isomerase, class I [Streptomyces sp. NPDC004296]|uniref:mannose-6-phosphate isomerase, class I n=1 Tax=Streptomyces sp. NPDC004296 TaxID=3364697 RepID=UPI0036BD921E